MLGLWLIIVGGVETVLSALAVIFRRFERPFAWVSLFVGLFAVVGGSILYWHDTNRWALGYTEREALRREACAESHRYRVPIFWATADSDAQSYAEDLFAVFLSCGWPVSLDGRAWVGPNVVGLSVNSFAGATQSTKAVSDLKQLFDRAGIQIEFGTEDQGHLMPDGVGIKVGSRPPI